ncbi:collagen binding domain-containing protein, partial [Anaerobacillus sp. 1_MG-2023]|uniref:MSCRAMM family protein n=1 Tax=Anaerobacillus sp. 1_MG-2023 TaxID=3062655 RepID=UPI0026FED9BB|nr:peptidase [Anaerobacillus sp. 1_MG-2023]
EETKAPFGYLLESEAIPFTIAKGQKDILKVTAENVIQPGSIKLLKVDKKDASRTLEGAEYSLLNEDGDVLQENLVTDE